jgi:hypothetical protein
MIACMSTISRADDARGSYKRVIRIDDRIEPKIDRLSVVLLHRDGLFFRVRRAVTGRSAKTAPLHIPVDPKGPQLLAYIQRGVMVSERPTS